MACKRRQFLREPFRKARLAGARWTDDAQKTASARVRQGPGALDQVTWHWMAGHQNLHD
jgi:hypothetical protein